MKRFLALTSLAVSAVAVLCLATSDTRGSSDAAWPSDVTRARVVYMEVFHEDFEAPGWGSRLGPSNAAVTHDPSAVVDGKASATLHDFGTYETNPSVVTLEPHTTYIVEFRYRGLTGDDGSKRLIISLHPIWTTNFNTAICLRPLLKNASRDGTYSGGALTGSPGSYYLQIMTMAGVTITIDDVRILRQDTVQAEPDLAVAMEVSQLPFPRLGNYLMGTTTDMAAGGIAEGTPFTYSVEDIERRAAAFDVLIGGALSDQTWDPDFPRRMRELNPNILILPYRIAQEESLTEIQAPLICGACAGNGNVYPERGFRLAVADQWFVRTCEGEPVADPVWGPIGKMNIYPTCPVVGGKVFSDYLADFVVNEIFGSGLWDGVYFDNLFDRISPHIPYNNDPSRLDFDINNDGMRDETPAEISELTRSAATSILQRIRSEVGNSQLILGNTGPLPARSLAPYANGYLFEGWNTAWCNQCSGQYSEGGWKRALDDYLYMTTSALAPRVSVVEGSGCTGTYVMPDHAYLTPTSADILTHRFTMGSAILGDGFYEYDLFEGRSAPYWFDEYTVSPEGVAVEDVRYKGYLGQPLGDAVELTTPSTVIWEADFEGTRLPAELWAKPGVRIGRSSDEVIAGRGSLIIDNPDHTRQVYTDVGTDPAKVRLQRGKTYVVEFDWRILDTIDGSVEARIWGSGSNARGYFLPGVVTGDAGHTRFPVTLTAGSGFSVQFVLFDGGGKVAIDSIRVTEGGAAPWRRDFENGFVLVNPLNQCATFDTKALTGTLGRTGMHRILGTQAPDVNNGQPVSGTLTLQPFDAIILIADHVERK